MRETVFIAGAGLIGGDLAILFANYGYDVLLFDISRDALNKAKASHKEKIGELRELDILNDEHAYENISYTVDISDVHDADFVFEAVVEDLKIKRMFFRDIEKYLSKDTVFATNTGSYTVTELSHILDHPDRLGAMHFSNPLIEMKLVEVVAGNKTSEEALEEIFRRSGEIGKKPILLDKECRGFVLNRLLYAASIDALLRIDMNEPPQNIDLGVKNLGVPFGVIEGMDLMGLDTSMRILENLNEVYGDRYSYPKHILMDKISEGRLGKKSGYGFYRWLSGKAVIPEGEGADPSRTVGVVMNEAFRIEDDEVAGKNKINMIYKLGVNSPIGIFDMMELFGIESLTDLLTNLYNEVGHSIYRPARL